MSHNCTNEDKLQFIGLFAAEGGIPSPGEKVAERSEVGSGMREIT
jgi:hypothetical protein